MFNGLFIISHLNRRRRNRALDEVQLVLLRQVIRLNKLLNRTQGWIAPLREYYWAPVLAFLSGVIIGLVITAVT
jgi:hypothetical protein